MTIIPTYDTDVLGYWVAENEDLLAELKIDLAPSASRCTINLQVGRAHTGVIISFRGFILNIKNL